MAVIPSFISYYTSFHQGGRSCIYIFQEPKTEKMIDKMAVMGQRRVLVLMISGTVDLILFRKGNPTRETKSKRLVLAECLEAHKSAYHTICEFLLFFLVHLQ